VVGIGEPSNPVVGIGEPSNPVVGIGEPSNRDVGMGEPSNDGIGPATAVYAQDIPTIRMSILTARFMVFLLGAGPLGAETLTCAVNYKARVKWFGLRFC
jgi:hypothetical protein